MKLHCFLSKRKEKKKQQKKTKSKQAETKIKPPGDPLDFFFTVYLENGIEFEVKKKKK